MSTDFERVLSHLADLKIPLEIGELYALSGMSPQELGIFTDNWRRIPLKRQRAIIEHMVRLGEESFGADFNAVFRSSLGSKDDQIRAKAIDGLWEVEETGLITPLVRMLKEDPSELVRERAAAALGRFALLAELEELDQQHSALVREALLESIRDEGETLEVRRRAVESVSFFGGEEIKSVIQTAYDHLAEKMRISAVFAMGRSLDPRWDDIVRAELMNPNPEMRYEAAIASGELGVSEAVAILVELIPDPDAEVQGAAIWALGQIGGREAKKALRACCHSEDEELAEAAREALEELEFNESLPEVYTKDCFFKEDEE